MSWIIEVDGIEYRRIVKKGLIHPGALRKLKNGVPKPVLHTDTIGLTPEDFPSDWAFYNKIAKKEIEK